MALETYLPITNIGWGDLFVRHSPFGITLSNRAYRHLGDGQLRLLLDRDSGRVALAQDPSGKLRCIRIAYTQHGVSMASFIKEFPHKGRIPAMWNAAERRLEWDLPKKEDR